MPWNKSVVSKTNIVLIILFVWGFAVFANRDKGLLKNNVVPTWRGITPSISTKNDVIRLLGQPNSEWVCRINGMNVLQRVKEFIFCYPWRTTFSYKNENSRESTSASHQITFSIYGRVSKIVETRFADPNRNEFGIAQVSRLYGDPEQIISSSRNIYYQAWLYCEKGIIVHVSETAGVGWIIYFTPMTTERCLEEHDDEVTEES